MTPSNLEMLLRLPKRLEHQPLSPECSTKLAFFARELLRWNKTHNLISRKDQNKIWDRHITESLEIGNFLPKSGGVWVDIGSGAGFPGLIMAILAQSQQPDQQLNCQFTLIESNHKKSAFLNHISRELRLNLTVYPCRAQEVLPKLKNIDFISARAVDSLTNILSTAFSQISNGAIGIFPKGSKADGELNIAQKTWEFHYRSFESSIRPEQKIICLWKN